MKLYTDKIIFLKENKGIFFLFLFILIYICSCKESETPDNPYSKVDYSVNQPNTSDPDPNSITGLHKNIFSKRCALSGCHDGTFEPDFRTVQSSYSSLVYHPVIKSTVDNVNYFRYRVVPNNINSSFIIERLVTSTSDYMPSNGLRLQQSLIDNVRNWISQGAKDQNGNLPVKPDFMPNINYYGIYNTALTYRYDTVRVGGIYYNAVIVPPGNDLLIPYYTNDIADSADATPASAFTHCRIEFSLNKDGFPSGNISNSTYYSNYQAWVSQINTGQWPSGTTVYFRIYVNDGHHAVDSEFPRNTSLSYYKSLYSIYVQ